MDNLAARNVQERFGTLAGGMEVRGRVLVVIHADHDPAEDGDQGPSCLDGSGPPRHAGLDPASTLSLLRQRGEEGGPRIKSGVTIPARQDKV
jgi:hypothetical protein